jgi:conjugal transfer pilus assembly protein TraW
MRYAFLVTLPCLLLNPGFTLANDLGVVGPTYEIVERDLIEVMKDKFRRMEKSGELARVQENYKQKVIDAVEKPRPVH